MNENVFFSFFIGRLNVAIPIEYIIKALPLLELKYIPDLPKNIIGLLNYQGDIYPVFDLRQTYNDDDDEITLNDSIIIGEKNGFKFGILATKIAGNITAPVKNILIDDANKDALFKDKYIQSETGLVYLSDPSQFLFDEEKKLLNSLLHDEN